MVSTNTSWRTFAVLIGASVVLTQMQHPTQTTTCQHDRIKQARKTTKLKVAKTYGRDN